MDDQEKLNEFGVSSYEAWLKLVDRDLAGAPFEKKLVKRVAGVDIRPLYTREDREPEQSLPGFAPYRRGGYALGAVEMGWEVRHEVTQAEPEAAAEAALDALNGGVRALTLRFDRATRYGSAEYGVDGIAASNLAELERALGQTRVDWVPIHLKAGANALPVAAALIALAQKRGLKLDALSGTFGADPLAALATQGTLPASLEGALAEAAELARFASEHTPRVRALSVDTSPYHNAGADAATEVAIALATGATYLRTLSEAGLSIDAAASQISFDFSIGRDVFVEIAKLRAARLTWSKLVAACGGSPASQVMTLHASTSLRTKTQRDPWVNLLRGTGESFAAAVGGADAITTLPFDALLGEGDDFGARMARNTQELLRHESNLNRVVDPAGGSWYVEAVTDGLARRAWEKLGEFERAGGLIEALRQGTLQKELGQALESERKAVETRKVAITGVNEFPNVREEAVARPRADLERARQRAEAANKASTAAMTLEAGKSMSQLIAAISQGQSFARVREALATGTPAKVNALTSERLAQPFETLRDAADRFAKQHGGRPAALLVNLGPIPEHKARAGFAQNYFEAGGFATIGNDGFADAASAVEAFTQSGAQVAVLCSSDTVYAELAIPTAEALRARGAKVIAMAGSPGDQEANYRAAGITDFIFVGANVVQSLRSLLERVGAV
jgi:methylmalonyl-CoA mutase